MGEVGWLQDGQLRSYGSGVKILITGKLGLDMVGVKYE